MKKIDFLCYWGRNRHFHWIFLSLLLAGLFTATCYGAAIVRPYEIGGNAEPLNEIDKFVLAKLKTEGVEPANLCSDAVFLRRAYLDITGQIPDPKAVRDFGSNTKDNKRAILIESLLEDDAFADYWSLKWCDILRVKAEFPINLWPNAVQAYHRWIHDALRENKRYDEFARELLCSNGSNFRVPQVNFYRATQGTAPATIAAAVSLTFMGSRFENWPKEKQDQMSTFFSRVAYKSTAEWKEQIVYPDPMKIEAFDAVLPDGTKVHIKTGQDPRVVFADWLIDGENPWFAKTIVNRIWYWLMGYGIIHEADDIRVDNPPSNPQLLAYLEKELVNSGWDLRHIYRLILNSRTYQQSCIWQEQSEKSKQLFACYPVRQLEAEVLIDALCKITGTSEKYLSMIPEPFTFIPVDEASIELADGSITSQFLEMFGRPSRDTGVLSERNSNSSEAQRLHLLNSTHIQKKIEKSWRLNTMMKASRGKDRMLIGLLYQNLLSRNPTPQEAQLCEEYIKEHKQGKRAGLNDLAWALMNSKEFLYRH